MSSFIPQYNLEPDFLLKKSILFEVKETFLTVYNFFDPHQNVPLQSQYLTFIAIIRGDAMLKLGDENLDLLTGESFLLLPGTQEHLQFPRTSYANPVQCMVIEFPMQRVADTLSLINEYYSDGQDEISDRQVLRSRYSRVKSEQVFRSVTKLLQVMEEEVSCKKLLIDTNITELLIRTMQTPLQGVILEYSRPSAHGHRIEFTANYIRQNLATPITLQALADQACMSKASFLRHFKQEFGVAPIEYINRERIRLSKKRLADPQKTVADVAFELGFKNAGYFIRTFKKYVGTTPKSYQQQLIAS
ncbi:AraC-type DNA-binding protein [Catalinimonas alkaloidigena]|uniref:AraC-type DNA-binding protein n=1 Tax=Catalinimonas alkaloidigena TaxID=1075417 RepID=A0A1G9UB32_9BACT|nr:AraC family transcriptional regulator [Catalinimonas alkaloidigena]SDM57151.1 AraC-type DNA-binding protein [Catalinimonas alkaloidigena]